MPPARLPYRAERHDTGTARDGRRLALDPMDDGAAMRLAPLVAAIGPWAHYGYPAATLTAFLNGEMGESHRFAIQCGSEIAGAVVIRYPWLAGPYLQMLAVLPAFQRQGIGERILDWYAAEARAAGQRQVWLCVSGVNAGAQRFYRTHGYELTATLDSLMRDGDDELLMRRRLV